MASSVKPNVTAPPAVPEAEHAVVDWLEKNRKVLTYAGVAAAVIAVGTWLFIETGRRKESAASDALDQARSALESGNLPTASAEFQRVASSYSGTDAAYQAELGLNEVRLASGQVQLAVDELRKFAEKGPPAFYASGAWAMMGGALENLKKFDEAAKAYAKAADLAVEDYRKVDVLIGEARADRLAGKEKEAVDVLRSVGSRFGKEVPGVAEAKVRLAELTRGAM
jgi:TolA-binding protein